MLPAPNLSVHTACFEFRKFTFGHFDESFYHEKISLHLSAQPKSRAMRRLITILLLITLSSAVFAQKPDLQVTLASGDIFWPVSIEKLVEDSIAISHMGAFHMLAVSSIVEIKREKQSKFWAGAGIGLLAGAAIMGTIASATYQESDGEWFSVDSRGMQTLGGVFVGGIAGVVVGGVVGMSLGKDEIYSLAHKSPRQKLSMINTIAGW